MSNRITTTHNGHEIEYREHSEKWYCEKWKHESESLTKLKAYIDRKVKEENGHGKFERFKAIFVNYESAFACEVTSVNDDGTCWIVVDGNRRKESKKTIRRYVDEFKAFNDSVGADEKKILELSNKIREERAAFIKKLTPAF